jgi:gliding motility-associated-like protein
VKYEFEILPNGEYENIKLQLKGHNGLEINQFGDLIIKTEIGNITEDAPYAYQYVNEKFRQVSCQYYLIDSITVGFKMGKNYNKNHTLILDPQLIFSTASGSVADNWGNTACLDNFGNLYAGGTIFPTMNGTSDFLATSGFITTAGAFQRNFKNAKGDTDMGIMKFDSAGQNLIYATYIGGDSSEIPTSIVTNDRGDLFILGVTSSPNMPSAVNNFAGGVPVEPVGGYTFENGTDINVLKLDASGSFVHKSIYVGGPFNDGNNMVVKNRVNFTFSNLLHVSENYPTILTTINYGDQLRGEIILDEDENIYIASSSNNAQNLFANQNISTNFPVKNAFQSNFGGGFQDAVIFKVNKSLDELDWSTYLGSDGPDAAYSLELGDSALYVTGICNGDVFARDSSAYQADNLGDYDAYIAKISLDGKKVLNYTYLGTSQKDASYFVEIDKDDDVYVLGQTFGDYGHSNDSIFYVNNEGVFIHKLDKNLQKSLFYSTIGGAEENFKPNFSPTAFLVNTCENIFIAGWGGQSNDITFTATNTNNQTIRFTYFDADNVQNLPITSNALKTNTDGNDFYMAVFLKDMDSLLFATYYGTNSAAEHVDGGTSRFSDQGIVYQSVCAGCGARPFVLFPQDSESEYPKQNASDNCNNGVFKYDLSSLASVIRTKEACGELNFEFENLTIGGVDYHWYFGDGKDTLVFNKDKILHHYDAPGRYLAQLVTTDLTTCKRRDTSSVTIFVSDRLIPKLFSDTLCKGEVLNWNLHTDTDFDYEWTPTKGISDPNTMNPTITAVDSSLIYTIKLTDKESGCVKIDTLKLFVPYFNPNLDLSLLSSCIQDVLPKIVLNANYTSNFKPVNLDWKVDTTSIISFNKSVVFDAKRFGNYHVSVKTSINGCVFDDTSSIFIPQIRIPNIITPNADNKNDQFKIDGLEEAGGMWKLWIFNRWGKQIFEDESYKNTWDAPIESAGTYFYEIESPDGTKCKGWFELVK